MKISFKLSRANQMILDGGAFAGSLIFVYLIRFESWPPGSELNQLLLWLPILVSLRLIVHDMLGIHRHVRKSVSFADVIEIGKSIVAVSAG
jgi:hypothetical protein